jgi:hypothetical protein
LPAAKLSGIESLLGRAHSDRIVGKGNWTMKRIYVRPTLTKAKQLQLIVATGASGES